MAVVHLPRLSPLSRADRDHAVRNKPDPGVAAPRVSADDRTPEDNIGGSLNTALHVQQSAKLGFMAIQQNEVVHPYAASRSARSTRASTV
jgi:hypothetical protein